MFKLAYRQLFRFCGPASTQQVIGQVTRSLTIASIIGGLLVIFPSGLLSIQPSIPNGVAILLNAVVLSIISIAATSKGAKR